MARLPSPVTRIGGVLRRLSLDELPQLVNVIRGEMSLVGPRPALPAQTELNTKRALAGVDALLPGITGWAQINGRDELDVDAKVARDTWYLRRRSLGLDIMILVRTLFPVFTGRGNR
jgi:O-antigen biosynthesis protein WbqP